MNSKGITPEKFCGRQLSENALIAFDELIEAISIPVKFEVRKRQSSAQMSISKYREALITMDSTIPQNNFDETLLHEMYHIVQMQNGFPSLNTLLKREPQYEQCTRIIDSCVLDLDVEDYIRSKGVLIDKQFAEQQYRKLKQGLREWEKAGTPPRLEPVLVLYQAALYTNILMTNNKQQGKHLIEKFSLIDSRIKLYSETIRKIIWGGNHNTASGVEEIFKQLIHAFPFMGWHISHTSDQLMSLK